jgi:hypothetical protein
MTHFMLHMQHKMGRWPDAVHGKSPVRAGMNAHATGTVEALVATAGNVSKL